MILRGLDGSGRGIVSGIFRLGSVNGQAVADSRQICRYRHIFDSERKDGLSVFIQTFGRRDLLTALYAAMAAFLGSLFIGAAVDSILVVDKPLRDHIGNGHGGSGKLSGAKLGIHGGLQAQIYHRLSVIQVIDTLILSGGDLRNTLRYFGLIGHQIKTVTIVGNRIVPAHIAAVLPRGLYIICRRPVRECGRRHNGTVVLPVQYGRDLTFVFLFCSHIYVGALYGLAYLSRHRNIPGGLKEHTGYAKTSARQGIIGPDLLQDTGANGTALL